MKEAFWKVDKSTGIYFSDKTDPNQPILFENDYSSDISESIMKKYEGEAIIVETIRLYIEDETSFTTYQMKGALKFLEMKGTIRIEPIKFNGKVRRKNTFADDVEIRFPPF